MKRIQNKEDGKNGKKRKVWRGLFVSVLALAVTLTGAWPAAATAADSVWFKDVSAGHWAYDKIKFAAEQGIISGYEDRTFRPEGMVTCEEAISMLYGTLAAADKLKDRQDHTQEYIDILDQAQIALWSRQSVSYALANHIITPDEIRTFTRSSGTGRPARREETAVWAGKAMQKPFLPACCLSYADTQSISTAAVPYVDLLLRERVMTGDNKNQFLPESNIKRCEFASICKSIVNSSSQPAFSLSRDIVNVSGSVMAVTADQGRLTLKGSDGLTRYITILSPTQSLADIGTGSTVVIGCGSFAEAGQGMNMQVPGKAAAQYTPQVSITEVTLLSSEGQAYYSISVAHSSGASAIYLMDSNTAVFNSSGEGAAIASIRPGQEAQIICDGIKLLELKLLS